MASSKTQHYIKKGFVSEAGTHQGHAFLGGFHLERWLKKALANIGISQILSGSSTVDAPSIAADASHSFTITVDGAAIGDAVALGVPAAANQTGLVAFASVTAANTVTVRLHNETALAIDLASGVFTVKVIK